MLLPLKGFYLKSLLFNFLVMQTLVGATTFKATTFEVITTLQLYRQGFNSKKIFIITAYGREE